VGNIEIRQKYQKALGQAMSQISEHFMSLSSHLEKEGGSSRVREQVNRLFKLWMKTNHLLTNETKEVFSYLDQLEERLEILKEEKRRLDILYTSGIVFSSELEMHNLMEKAISTVVTELRADAGSIILCNQRGDIETIINKNIHWEKEPQVQKISMSVIHNTLKNAKPTNLGSKSRPADIVRANSILSLGIKSALCVPLISEKKVFGAVYLDRRKQTLSFNESELIFLMSFARQIVQGMEISSEIQNLEKRLIDEANFSFEALRSEFKCDHIIGSSKKLFDVLKIASKISATSASVIILGENGTGKELLARAIHKNSRRADKPFVPINCAAIPADLLESELFGYEPGAFSGAVKSKPGKIELADGGTLFLDEIGEMPLTLQVKILRFLQTQEIERLGSVQTRKINVRIIAATNKDLPALVANGQFRQDLYYRLKVVELTMPPLAERREDIAELSEYFLKTKCEDRGPCTISDEALEILEAYHWPGNIRELENVILHGIVLAKNNHIKTADLPQELQAVQKEGLTVPRGKTLNEAETEFRKLYILKTLRRSASKAEAAKTLGVNRTHFYRILAQLGID